MRYLRPSAALAAVLLSGSAALAQPDAHDADSIVETCRAERNSAARIACLELAIYRMAGETAPPASVDAGADMPAAAMEPPASGIGAEQVESRREREAPVPADQPDASSEQANVVGFARTVQGKLVLVLDNGQVWAQRDSDDEDVVLTEGQAYPVEIREGFISGYRMRFVEQRRILRVERLR